MHTELNSDPNKEGKGIKFYVHQVKNKELVTTRTALGSKMLTLMPSKWRVSPCTGQDTDLKEGETVRKGCFDNLVISEV